jgi:hypothetical protein
MNVSATTVIHILAVGIAIATQYNIFENKLNDIQYNIENYKQINIDKDANIQSMAHEIKQLESQLALTNSIIDSMQIRMSTMKK